MNDSDCLIVCLGCHGDKLKALITLILMMVIIVMIKVMTWMIMTVVNNVGYHDNKGTDDTDFDDGNNDDDNQYINDSDCLWLLV